MITRRGLFGFACGGAVVAAATPLVGECPSNGRLALAGEIGPESVMPTFTYPDTPYYIIEWPSFGIPFDVAKKGFNKALADGDIDADGDLFVSAQSEAFA